MRFAATSSTNCWTSRPLGLHACMPRSLPPVPRKLLVVATSNPGKLQEFRALLADLPFDLRSLGDLGIAPPEESGASFLDNALLKARHAAAAAGKAAAIADDSGLEVDALAGAKLLNALRGVSREQRRARYRCALVFVDGPGDPAPLIAEGVWEGLILESPPGEGGFGYDPYFWLPDLELTAAQLDMADKNRRSHRGIALRSLLAQLAAREPSPGCAQPGLAAQPV